MVGLQLHVARIGDPLPFTPEHPGILLPAIVNVTFPAALRIAVIVVVTPFWGGDEKEIVTLVFSSTSVTDIERAASEKFPLASVALTVT